MKTKSSTTTIGIDLGDAFSYFLFNAAELLLFSGVSGAIVFSMLFGTAKSSPAQQAMVGNPAGWSAPVVNSGSTSARWLPTF